ncbi:MAG: M50 family metallopeptidase [Candidatus Caldarchaeum sp.]
MVFVSFEVLNVFIQVAGFLVLVTIVVVIHEFGHYWAARLSGMTVEEFAVGFWKKLVSVRTRSGTEWSLRLVPLGGFVRVKGLVMEEETPEGAGQGSFYSRPTLFRAFVVAAGPLASIVGGYLVLLLVFAGFGEMVPDEKPVVGAVVERSPAEQAGIKPKDVILSMNDTPIREYMDIRLITQDSAGKPLVIRLRRGSEVFTLTVTPRLSERPMPVLGKNKEPLKDSHGQDVMRRIGQIGIVPGIIYRPMPLAEAHVSAYQLTWRVLTEFPKVLASPHRLKEEAGGPIMIARISTQAAQEGLPAWLLVLGLISISLGLVNLLPFPPFDGGRLLITFIEALRKGQRLSPKVEAAIMTVGLIMIGLIFVAVLTLDISRLLER